VSLPLLATAQINRSAKELASEQVRDYIIHKLFRDQPYKSVSFGELSAHKENDSEIAWKIVHEFEIITVHKYSDEKPSAPKPYKFLFYLDSKMRVLRAESFFSY
jgi:hypothetical protein